MIGAVLLAGMCTYIEGNIDPAKFSTVSPTIQGDHDRSNTEHYRIYAKEPESNTWNYVFEVANTFDVDYGDGAPGILTQWPVLRMLPPETSLRDVQFVIKAVSAENVESAPSNVLTICMPLFEEINP